MAIKKIDTSLVSTTVGMRFKSGMLKWLQSQHDESMEQLILSVFPALNSMTALRGCTNSGAGTHFIISGGTIYLPSGFPPLNYFDALLLSVPSANFTATGAATVFLVKSNSMGTDSDPVAFSDGSSHNVIMAWTAVVGDSANPPVGSLGTIGSYASLKFLKNPTWVDISTLGYINNWQGPSGHLGSPIYRKVNVPGEPGTLGLVKFEGSVRTSSLVLNSPIVNNPLPAGYRPAANSGNPMFYLCPWVAPDITVGEGNPTAMAIVSIDSGGNLMYRNTMGTPTDGHDELLLSGITYFAEG